MHYLFLKAECHSPPSMAHADVRTTGEHQYDNATYTCHENYVMKNEMRDTSVQCQADSAEWEDFITYCICKSNHINMYLVSRLLRLSITIVSFFN